VGVDLNPGPDNPWVMYGDFHQLQYADATLDTVYSNSLDHCLEPARVLSEIRRLLNADGSLIVEADPGVEDADGIAPDMWATFQWKSVSALRALIEANGFDFASESRFDYPRNGTALLFRRRK
jgi:ubiquinone/menaquinone biosynthesis C-methylase UbiE